MRKRRRPRFDPLASQPRSTPRRPGNFNEQADYKPDPNTEFLATHSSAVGGDPTQGLLRLFQSIRQRFSRGRRDRAD